jgi:hypothetical protein
MGELSFLTIIVSLAVCSILVFAVYQYMKVRFTVLEHSQKEQALILQQYIEESSYDIQGLQSIVFRQSQPQHQAQPGAGSEPVEIFEDHNKHIHMDTVMYEAPNKQRSALIAISSDSEDTTSDESSESSESSEGSESSESSESSGSESEGSESSGSESEIECDNIIHDIHEVKHIEISLPTDNNNNVNELDVVSVTVIDETSPEEPVSTAETSEIKTVTVDLGTSPDTSSISTDTIDVLSLLNKTAEEHDVDTDLHFTVPTAAAASAASASFQGLSVIELRALLKEKYKGQPDKVPNLQKLKKPELIQLLQE